jgi:hypothetical protein
VLVLMNHSRARMTVFYNHSLLELDKYLAHIRMLLTTTGLCLVGNRVRGAAAAARFGRRVLMFQPVIYVSVNRGLRCISPRIVCTTIRDKYI